MTDRLALPRSYRNQLEALLSKHVPGVEVWAYGSRVNGESHDGSDLDLVLRGPALEPLDGGFFDLLEAIEKSNVPILVQAHDWAMLPESFHREIERDYVVVQEPTKEKQCARVEWRESVYGMFRSDFLESSLGSLCNNVGGVQTGPFGSQLHRRDYVPTGTPIITVEHLGENRITHHDMPHVSDHDRDRLSKYALREGDIVFSRVGSVDRRALVRNTEEGWLFSGRCLRVRPDVKEIDPTYLSYFFGLPAFQEFVRSIAVGATMPSLNTKILSDVSIFYPPLPKQRAIAHVLGTLDDKIELNRRMNETLEEMARALFKSWFVDFEPVRAKMEDRWRRGESLPGLPAEHYDLFPDRLVDSELGPVPEEWEVGRLGEVVQVVKGRSYRSADLRDSKVALVTLKSVKRGGGYSPNGLKAYTGEYLPAQVAKAGDVVVAQTDVTQDAEVIGRTALVNNSPNYNTLVVSLDLLVIRPALPLTIPYLYRLLQSHAFIGHALAHVNGTTVLHMQKDAVPEFRFALPPEPVIASFTRAVAPLDSTSDNNARNSNTLTSVRDALLPRLVSGEQVVNLTKFRRL